MSFKFLNTKGVSLAMAPFLTLDEYDYDDSEKTISATTLLKPVRALIIGQQNPAHDKEVELMDLAPIALGSAMHKRLEDAWKDDKLVKQMLAFYGFGEYADKVAVNPEKVEEGMIPIFTERRFSRKLNDWTIRGQADLILDGHLHDLKTCSVWAAIFDSNAEQYKLQGSIYRWLSQGLIVADHINIELLFTDWSQTSARKDTQYPQNRLQSKRYELLSLEETEKFIGDKIALFEKYLDAPQEDLPTCTPEELWQTETKFKYYKKVNAKRATKVYNNSADAYARLQEEGSGIVKEERGQVKACNYCPVVAICDQAKNLINQGLLIR